MLIPRDLSRLDPLQRAYVDDLRRANESRRSVFESAIAAEHEKLARDPGDGAAWLKVAKLQYRFEQFDECIDSLLLAVQRARPDAPLWWHALLRLMAAGRADEALEIASDAERRFPDDLRFRVTRYVAFPALFDSDESVALWTARLTDGLAALRAGDPVLAAASPSSLLDVIVEATLFYADYLPQNTRDWHAQWGAFVHGIVNRAQPEATPPPAPPVAAAPPRRGDGRIRVAIVSEVLRHHIIGFLFVAWALDLDPERFELFCYGCHQVNDFESEQWAGAATRMVRAEDAATIAAEIRADQPDVILYLAVGMAREITELAAQRLAPVQCAVWGHPVSTGLPTIDYFLSADAVEPPDAAAHYSEKLIRLPGMATRFELPQSRYPLHVLTRADYGLSDTDLVFVCMQSVSKFLPAFDEVMIAIARELPNSRFAFAFGGHLAGGMLLRRIRRAFAHAGLDWARHGVELPKLNEIEYRNLFTVSDVLLDAHGWTAGYTALDAVACGLPIVALEGGYFRTRQSSSMLRIMGETRTIGSTPAECVGIAVRLGRDPELRASVRERLLDPEAQRRLCDDRSYMPALEQFLESAVAATRPSSG